MKRYYFDIQHGSQFIRDDEGVELPHSDAAREEATAALAEMASGWARNRPHHHIAIKVRDDHGPILQASASFVLKPSCDLKASGWHRNEILDAD
ncbi:hypothetical protein SAMN05216573_13513 [Bradyrhizobium sp. Rc3b]|uniref:DUF6894 family protein n=1 Tax=Bradyrhizobium sp. Rc3b TaxID=1855322 RepID=UPI0008E6A6C8|nr:hypothetical protein [Bradyrhizobium sp. Rc3b]SFN96999.1 hypothetical protein SAMN05216573_13513 [Bradyrhizobium sp. Rc3b]